MKKYNSSAFRFDLFAGLTVGVMLIPQAMAYGMLAGVPPMYGLYAGLIPLLVYSFFATSRHLSVGPVAVSALLVLGGISQVAEPGTHQYLSLVILTGFLVGCCQLLLAVFRMGFIVNFLSHPVIAGFTSAAAVIISISQIPDALGLEKSGESHPMLKLWEYITEISSVSLWPVIFSIAGILFYTLMGKLSSKIPRALVLFVVAIIASYFLHQRDVLLPVIGSVPKGLPSFLLPEWSLESIRLVLPTVLAVTIIGIVESLGIAKALESKQSSYTVKPNQELFALGLSKLLGSFFQAIPSSGSFGRSAINFNSKAVTGVSSLISALLVALVLMAFTGAFYYLPKAILAVIILMAVKGLFEWKEALHVWKTDRRDLKMLVATFFGTLIFGIEEGVLIGVVLSVLVVLLRSSKPDVFILGNVPGTTYYRNIERFTNANITEEVLIVRFDNQLYFGNAAYFRDEVKKLVNLALPQVKTLVLDAKSIYDIDTSGLHALDDLIRFLEIHQIKFVIAGGQGNVRDVLVRGGIIRKIGDENHYIALHDAVQYAESKASTPV